MAIHYRLYEDRDAEQIMEMFRKNRFYLGKRPADAEDFRYAWKARGGLFALVGETEEGRIIAYLAVYPTGDRIVCAPHQVVMGGMLIDREYQRQLYSLPEMYAMAVRQICRDPGITTLISEVDDFRRQSLLIQRYLGSVLLNGSVPCAPHVFSFYNFMPGLFRLYDPASETRKAPMMRMLPKADKRRATEPDPVRDGRFADIAYQLPDGPIRFSCHIPSGLAARAETEAWALGLEDDLETVSIRFTETGGRAAVEYHGRGGLLKAGEVTCAAGETVRETIPEGTEKIYIRPDGARDSYWFEPAEMKRAEPAAKPAFRFGLFEFDPETGVAEFPGKFALAWPEIRMPYRIGSLYAQRRPGLQTEIKDENTLCARARDGHGELALRYRIGDGAVRVHPAYAPADGAEIRPLFQLYIRDLRMEACFIAEDGGEQAVRVDFDRDLKSASPEIPYVLLGPRKNEISPAREILLRFPDEAFRIRPAKPSLAYLQFEYLTVEPVPEREGSGGYDFGEIEIIRIPGGTEAADGN